MLIYARNHLSSSTYDRQTELSEFGVILVAGLLTRCDNFTVLKSMAALRSRCGHYIFVLFLSFFSSFSSPNLSGRRLDVYHTSTHGVVLVRI